MGQKTVFNPEMKIFPQDQGKQEVLRRRTFRTPHKKPRRLTQRLREKTISG
jgi:hypothetical protein